MPPPVEPTVAVAQPADVTGAGEGLERVIGVRTLAANALNLTVGAGIFVLPAVVAARLGAAAFVAYLVCAVAMVLVLLCFAEAGSRVFASGGACAYVEAAFGPFFGFLVSSLLWFGYAVAADAAIGNALVDTLASVAPAAAQPVPRALLLGAVFAVLAAINIRGARQGARTVEVLTLAKLVPLVGLVLVGLAAVRTSNLAVASFPSLAEIGSASLVLFFAFGGSESSLTASGEIRDPARTVPRGVLLGIAAVVLLYVSIQVVAQGVLGSGLAENAQAPLAATAGQVLGAPGRVVLLVGALVSMVGCLSGDLLSSPRAIFASARDGVLPRLFAAVHPRYHTPWAAIGLFALLGWLLAVSGAFEPLAILSSAAILIVYLLTVLAAVELRRRDVRASVQAFVLPGGVTVHGLACLVVVFLLAQVTQQEVKALLVLVAGTALVYAWRRLGRRG